MLFTGVSSPQMEGVFSSLRDWDKITFTILSFLYNKDLSLMDGRIRAKSLSKAI
jgi:hypothetical protein